MNTIPKSFRIRINRAAHDQAQRHELQLREAWTLELSAAMERKATYTQLQALIVRLESGTASAAKQALTKTAEHGNAVSNGS